MNKSSIRSSFASLKGSSGGSMHFYEYEYEYEIKNTSYKALMTYASTGVLSSPKHSSLPDYADNKIKIYGYGINLI